MSRIPKHVAAIEIRPFGWQLYLVNQKRHYGPMARYCGRDISKETIADSQGLCTRINERRTVVVGVFNGCSGTLVHELTHAMIAVLEYSGQPIEYYGSEIAAHMMGDLYRRCTDALNAH